MSIPQAAAAAAAAATSPPPHLYPQELQLKLYQAFIFSIPILFSIILFLLFYLFYLKRRASSLSSSSSLISSFSPTLILSIHIMLSDAGSRAYWNLQGSNHAEFHCRQSNFSVPFFLCHHLLSLQFNSYIFSFFLYTLQMLISVSPDNNVLYALIINNAACVCTI